MRKTSVMHKDIGEHEHDVIIFRSFETYAVCKKCGMHDWGKVNKDGEGWTVEKFQNKYPKNEVDEL